MYCSCCLASYPTFCHRVFHSALKKTWTVKGGFRMWRGANVTASFGSLVLSPQLIITQMMSIQWYHSHLYLIAAQYHAQNPLRLSFWVFSKAVCWYEASCWPNQLQHCNVGTIPIIAHHHLHDSLALLCRNNLQYRSSFLRSLLIGSLKSCDLALAHTYM